MNTRDFIKKLDFSCDKEELSSLKEKTKLVVEWLKEGIKESKIEAEVFVGGSLAKETIVKSEEYDVDIFIRFDWKYENLSDDLEKIIKKISGRNNLNYERVHGSRDYFKIGWDKKTTLEIIPVVKIKNPKEERNVTDLSYFHVNYVKSRLKNEKLRREVRIAKKFFKANGIYGAESYIQGFSGYGLECLIINYGSFFSMIKELSDAKERLILDPEKKFKKKNEILLELNESKMQGPIVLVDPTWKERNVLAGLSQETFKKAQTIMKEFLRRPDSSFFEKKQISEEEFYKTAKKQKGEFLNITLETDKQPGDIAGTKLKKFCRMLLLELKQYFDIKEEEFVYSLGKKANLYLIIKNKKEFVKIGPPVNLKEAVRAFKKANKRNYVKNGMIHSKEKIDFSGKEFLEVWIKKYNKKAREMDIVSISWD